MALIRSTSLTRAYVEIRLRRICVLSEEAAEAWKVPSEAAEPMVILVTTLASYLEAGLRESRPLRNFFKRQDIRTRIDDPPQMYRHRNRPDDVAVQRWQTYTQRPLEVRSSVNGGHSSIQYARI
jgi:hypothetical protein